MIFVAMLLFTVSSIAFARGQKQTFAAANSTDVSAHDLSGVWVTANHHYDPTKEATNTETDESDESVYRQLADIARRLVDGPQYWE